ncbi:MAG TPA: hypothetical protein VG077_20110 [Verrucomicrobiae bacterium]|nr:hypothetical protein [Verrucomicrobiae bacterium]
MKTLLALVTTSGLLCLTSAFGSIYLDQSQPIVDTTVGANAVGGSSDQLLAQVATAGMSGWLNSVGLPVAGSGTLIVQIERVNGGIPNGTVLTSQTIPGSSLPDFLSDPTGFRRLDLSAPVNFSAGDQFAIVLSVLNAATDDFSLLQGPLGDPYQGGAAFFNSQPNPAGIWVPLGDFGRSDLPFQTYVTPVPEPGVLSLIILAGLVPWSLRFTRAAWRWLMGLLLHGENRVAVW